MVAATDDGERGTGNGERGQVVYIRLPIPRSPFPLLLVLLSCRGSLSPLSNKLRVGQEPYVAFAADGEDGLGDLFASGPAGGTPYQITFSRVDEALPALSPDGSMLAFVRTTSGDEKRRLVVMNLLTGAERWAPLGGTPSALGWSRDGSRIYVRNQTTEVTLAPPAELGLARVAPAERPVAESALAVLLGDPPLAEVVACDSGRGLCARYREGPEQMITATGEAPARWSGDTVAYLQDGEWVIRPLAGGRTRVLRWARPLAHSRNLTLFPGPRPTR
ncbi:MAG TPA: hypothetical protein VH879_01115 [Gemmatimonadales bacterium]